MNRRDFFKWIGRLFAALPFVALADLEPDFQMGDLVPIDDLMKIWSQSSVETPIKWMPDGETIHSISLKDTLAYDKNELQEIWDKLRELGGLEDGFYYRYILKPNSTTVKYNL